jgi:hypothetical protein
MRRKNKTTVLAITAAGVLGVLAAAAPTLSHAAPSSGSFRLRATVPVSCWVRPERPIEAVSLVEGVVTEACNNPGGYTVTAHHRPLSPGESGSLMYGASAIDLGGLSSKIVSRSSRATIRKVNYRFNEVKLEAPLVLVLTIQPI